MAVQTQRDEAEADAYDAARLRAQADALESKASALKDQARGLLEQAVDYRVEADRLTREPLVMLNAADAKKGSDDTRFLDRIVETLDGAGPLAMRDIADHLGATPARVRAGLVRLAEVGTVVRSGIKSGTRYELAEDDDAEASASVHAITSYEAVVRDAAIKLDTFEFVDLQRALPDLSEPTLRRWVRRLEDRGVVASEHVGRTKVYAYVPAESDGTTRRRYEAPEKEATRLAGPVKVTGGDVVSGRNTRTGSSIVNELIRQVRPYGVTVEKTKHRVDFVLDGVVIANASGTPGASSLKQTRSELRKAGVPV